MNTHSFAIPHPEVIPTKLPNCETVLLHLGTQTYYSLNETGSRIWELMSKGVPLGQIGQALENQYEVSLDQAQQYVIALIAELAAEKLVSLTSESHKEMERR